MKRYYLRQPDESLRCVLCRGYYQDRDALTQHYRPGRHTSPCKPPSDISPTKDTRE